MRPTLGKGEWHGGRFDTLPVYDTDPAQRGAVAGLVARFLAHGATAVHVHMCVAAAGASTAHCRARRAYRGVVSSSSSSVPRARARSSSNVWNHINKIRPARLRRAPADTIS